MQCNNALSVKWEGILYLNTLARNTIPVLLSAKALYQNVSFC